MDASRSAVAHTTPTFDFGLVGVEERERPLVHSRKDTRVVLQRDGDGRVAASTSATNDDWNGCRRNFRPLSNTRLRAKLVKVSGEPAAPGPFYPITPNTDECG